MKPLLQKRVERDRLKNVIFHPPVSKARLAELMAGAHIGLQILADVPAFYYGTSPNKFFDYISAGLPVLNNYPGWLAEMIVKEDCGFSVAPGDAEAFADALEWAADDRIELKAKGSRALGLASRDFDRRSLADRWVRWVTKGERR